MSIAIDLFLEYESRVQNQSDAVRVMNESAREHCVDPNRIRHMLEAVSDSTIHCNAARKALLNEIS